MVSAYTFDIYPTFKLSSAVLLSATTAARVVSHSQTQPVLGLAWVWLCETTVRALKLEPCLEILYCLEIPSVTLPLLSKEVQSTSLYMLDTYPAHHVVSGTDR